MSEISETAVRILVVDYEASIREPMAKMLVKEGYEVDVAADGVFALDHLRKKPTDLILADLKMPKMDGLTLLRTAKAMGPALEVIVITGHGTIDDAVQALKHGAYDFIHKPFKRHDLLRSVSKALGARRLVQENQKLKEKLAQVEGTREIIGTSRAMKSLLDLVAQVAPSTATVLIRGESGTGKELIAAAIHRLSRRSDGPFVRVSCAALPDSLLEAELFGHEKGAFTGAMSLRKGRFEVADGGTLFLDEIGEIPLPTQVKLLRVLQEGEFERVGSSDTIKSDVRVVSATNSDLLAKVKEGTFREDLYYRLNVVDVLLPPLRERPDDIVLLADHFLQKYSLQNEKEISGFTDQARQALERYPWPGNVRELENAVERAVVMVTESTIGHEHLPASVSQSEPHGDFIRVPFGMTMKEAKRKIILETLEHAGDKSRAASMLGIAGRTIYRTVANEDTLRVGL